MNNDGLEINFDGMVGPTHHYGGLSYGNIASMEHGFISSNPKKAALEGLEKMEMLRKLGLTQAILPPQERPYIPVLWQLGYFGPDEEIIGKASKENPSLLSRCSSSSSMWAANAATISPSADSLDKRVHFTPANLISTFHRSFESHFTGMIFFRIFQDHLKFAHHLPLPFQMEFADEGAANHTRLCKKFDQPGIQLFVYGRSSKEEIHFKFPARQTKEASQAIVRLHRLNPDRVVLAQQNPDAINAGVFHNDVISTGNGDFFFYHEKSFINTPRVIEELKNKYEKVCCSSLITVEVKENEIPINLAVQTYLFNSQIVSLPDQSMAMIAPMECRRSEIVFSYLKSMVDQKIIPIKQIIYQEVRESMQNGGGPACLRLRVPLASEEIKSMAPNLILTESLYSQLVDWVKKYYRDKLVLSDLGDPQFLFENYQALDELTQLLKLGPLYSFQQRFPPGKKL